MLNSSQQTPTPVSAAPVRRRASRYKPRAMPALVRWMQGRHFSPSRVNHRGAIVVEFVVVLMPLLITLFSFLQMGYLYQSVLVLRHAADVAARAAAVITVKEENNPNASGKKEEIDEAAFRAAGRFAQSELVYNIKVDVNDKSSKTDPYGMVEITLTADIKCSIPLGGQIACGAKGYMSKTIKSAYPHQGALYKVEAEEKK
jgi:hypothetical protein